jgi:hypothetical protein
MFIAEPRKGFFRTRLTNGGILVRVMFWHGHAVIDGERQDRGLAWRVAVNGRTTNDDGELLDPFEVWPFACGQPITGREYRFMARRVRWADKHAPEHPAAQPRRPVDRRRMKPIF